MFKTIKDIKDAAARSEDSLYWFSPDTLKFFSSRIGSKIYPTDGGAFFITSEQRDEDEPRLYSVRFAHNDGTIETASAFMEFDRAESAHVRAQNLCAVVKARGITPMEAAKFFEGTDDEEG